MPLKQSCFLSFYEMHVHTEIEPDEKNLVFSLLKARNNFQLPIQYVRSREKNRYKVSKYS